LLLSRVPDDREQVAADAAGVRLDQRQHRVRRNGRVDRAAALLQYLHGD
jgi:hypothetical protein